MFKATPRRELALPASSVSPAAARAWTRHNGCQEHVLGLLDDALLLITELVTNAVLHGGPPIRLVIECDDATLHVRVRDGSPALPTRQKVGPESAGGRGMTLVELLTSAWGVALVDDDHGIRKEVWFELRR